MQEQCHFWLWRWKEVCDESSPETGTLRGMAFPSDTLRWNPSCLRLGFGPIEPTSDFSRAAKAIINVCSFKVQLWGIWLQQEKDQ